MSFDLSIYKDPKSKLASILGYEDKGAKAPLTKKIIRKIVEEVREEAFIKSLLIELLADYIESLEFGGGQWIPEYIDKFLETSEVWNGKNN